MDTTIMIEGFEWDTGNRLKNFEKHGVTWSECEQIFFNKPIYILPDIRHSEHEDRFYCLGHTDTERLLFITFTLRNKNIRVISARDMNRKEQEIYYEKAKEHTGF